MVGLGKKRETVICHIKNKQPFQGFPCKGSKVCIPLHWVCDGEDDCKGKYLFLKKGLLIDLNLNFNNFSLWKKISFNYG